MTAAATFLRGHRAVTADIVELIGNPRTGSRTRALAHAATSAIVAAADAGGVQIRGIRTLELADISSVSFGPDSARALTIVDDPHGLVRSAKLLIVATPTYKGTYTGLLKVFLDQYGHRELAGIVAVPIGTAAAEPHLQSVGTNLRDLLVELGATVPAPPFTVLERDLGDHAHIAADWVARHSHLLLAAFARTNSVP
jgi:FMN reductase